MSPFQMQNVIYQMDCPQPAISYPAANAGEPIVYYVDEHDQVIYPHELVEQNQLVFNQPQPLSSLPHHQSTIIYDAASLGFESISVRMDYVRKVLGVLFAQIGICFLIVNIFSLKMLKEWGETNSWFLWMCLFSALSILVLLGCCAEEGNSSCPVNIILCGLFTFSMSLAIGSTSQYEVNGLSLIYLFDVALIISFALVFSLILYAFQNRFDFNMMNCIKYVVVIVTVFVAVYLLLIITWSVWLVFFLPTVAYAVAGALTFTTYVISDLTLMMRRSYVTGLTPRSVLYGVILLHTDIINPNGNFWGKC